MHVVQPRQEKKLVVTVRPWEVGRGHMNLPRGGTHKDRRRPSRVNGKARLRRAIAEG